MRAEPCSATLEEGEGIRRSAHALGYHPQGTPPGVTPNLADYNHARSDSTWSQARTALAGLPGGGLNMAFEAVDRHAGSDHGDKVALRCIARDNAVSTVTYSELARRTARFANVLRSLGSAMGTGCSPCSGAVPSFTPRCWAR